jgi:hypothetical protein
MQGRGANLKSFARFLAHKNPEMRLIAARVLGNYRTRVFLGPLEAAGRAQGPRRRQPGHPEGSGS